MTSKFAREPRYIVLKITDMEKYLNKVEQANVLAYGSIIGSGRASDGKPPFNAVVVEQDWPEFDMVWEAIEKRMTKGN
jgi:hypothetical protein